MAGSRAAAEGGVHDVGRGVADGVHQLQQFRAHCGRRGRDVGGQPGEPIGVLTRVRAEPQRAAHAVDDLGRGCAFAALLESRVVVDAHAGQDSDLFAAQARDSAAPTSEGATRARCALRKSPRAPG